MARDTCISTATAFFSFSSSDYNVLFVGFHVETTQCTWRGTVYYHQVFAIAGWRPSTTRPVPYQCFFTCMCSNIPQWFCFQEFTHKCFLSHIQFTRYLNIIVNDTMSHWIATCSQSCPQWWCNGWHSTQHYQVFTGSTHVN